MTEHTVVIGDTLDLDSITISAGDTVIWRNESAQVQSVSSNDGVTFTTGLIQLHAQSLPIVFVAASASVAYTCTGGMHGTIVVAVGFEESIKPYFTLLDRTSMMDASHTFGIITFDLWSRDDCIANWQAVNDSIASGSMPPDGDDSDGPWPQAKIDKFVLDFALWRDGGFQP